MTQFSKRALDSLKICSEKSLKACIYEHGYSYTYEFNNNLNLNDAKDAWRQEIREIEFFFFFGLCYGDYSSLGTVEKQRARESFSTTVLHQDTWVKVSHC